MATLSWSLTLSMSGSGSLSVARAPVAVEAIDRVEVPIAPGDSKTIDIQPGAAGAVQLLLIKSSSYGNHLTFRVSNGTTEFPASPAPALALDSPQLFSAGSVAVFGLAPNQLKFSNSSTDKPATVEILVGRDATP